MQLILLYPALVQGDGASEQHRDKESVCWKNKQVDVMIVGRGGGSHRRSVGIQRGGCGACDF